MDTYIKIPQRKQVFQKINDFNNENRRGHYVFHPQVINQAAA